MAIVGTAAWYHTEWNKGYQDFVDGVQPFGCASKSDAWNDGYFQAREDVDIWICRVCFHDDLPEIEED